MILYEALHDINQMSGHPINCERTDVYVQPPS